MKDEFLHGWSGISVDNVAHPCVVAPFTYDGEFLVDRRFDVRPSRLFYSVVFCYFEFLASVLGSVHTANPVVPDVLPAKLGWTTETERATRGHVSTSAPCVFAFGAISFRVRRLLPLIPT